MSINIHFMNVCVQHNSTKGYTRLAVASDKVYQLLANGRWFSPGTLASSTTYAGRHDIAEILLKVALNTKNQSINIIQWKGRYLSIRLFNKKIYLWYSFLIVTWTLPPPLPTPPIEPSWLWSYGRCVYNYICNRCIHQYCSYIQVVKFIFTCGNQILVKI